MLSIRQLLTCAFQAFGGQNSARRKKVSKCIHYNNIEIQVPVFFHFMEVYVHDSKVIIEIPYKPSSCYIFDRGYNNFKMLY